MAKYDPLQAYLTRRGSAEIELAFEEIERIIGTSLPAAATRPQWWTNAPDPDSNQAQCTAWLEAGYDAFLLPGRRALFTEQAA